MQFIDGNGNVTVTHWGGWQVSFEGGQVDVSALGAGGFSAPSTSAVVANQMVNEFFGTWRDAGEDFIFP